MARVCAPRALCIDGAVPHVRGEAAPPPAEASRERHTAVVRRAPPARRRVAHRARRKEAAAPPPRRGAPVEERGDAPARRAPRPRRAARLGARRERQPVPPARRARRGANAAERAHPRPGGHRAPAERRGTDVRTRHLPVRVGARGRVRRACGRRVHRPRQGEGLVGAPPRLARGRPWRRVPPERPRRAPCRRGVDRVGARGVPPRDLAADRRPALCAHRRRTRCRHALRPNRRDRDCAAAHAAPGADSRAAPPRDRPFLGDARYDARAVRRARRHAPPRGQRAPACVQAVQPLVVLHRRWAVAGARLGAQLVYVCRLTQSFRASQAPRSRAR